jgi:AraC-like DNA-binding protein
MPIFMDVHYMPGVKAKDVAQAHELDLLNQVDHGCKCMTYWIDELRESIFCLIEGPTKDAVEELHRKAHGLLPSKVIEVNPELVQSFLGRIYDPENAQITAEGLKVFEDPSFRILLATRVTDPVLLEQKLGKKEANELLGKQNAVIRKTAKEFGGKEAEHAGIGFIIAFSSATRAAECGISILREISQADAAVTGLKIGINSGEPIEKSSKFFGDTIRYALNLCSLVNSLQVAISSSVKDLVSRDFYQDNRNRFFSFNPQDEDFLKNLFEKLEANWQDSNFDVDDYCREMAMSRSQLYRKSIALTGFSPNILLKEFRLEAAKEMMKNQRHSISQVTFNSGFTSPSYFTKCFRKKFGLLPMTYLELLHDSVSS